MTSDSEPIQEVIARVTAEHPIARFRAIPICSGCENDWPCDPVRLARELTAALAEVERLRRVAQVAEEALLSVAEEVATLDWGKMLHSDFRDLRRVARNAADEWAALDGAEG